MQSWKAQNSFISRMAYPWHAFHNCYLCPWQASLINHSTLSYWAKKDQPQNLFLCKCPGSYCGSAGVDMQGDSVCPCWSSPIFLVVWETEVQRFLRPPSWFMTVVALELCSPISEFFALCTKSFCFICITLKKKKRSGKDAIIVHLLPAVTWQWSPAVYSSPCRWILFCIHGQFVSLMASQVPLSPTLGNSLSPSCFSATKSGGPGRLGWGVLTEDDGRRERTFSRTISIDEKSKTRSALRGHFHK